MAPVTNGRNTLNNKSSRNPEATADASKGSAASVGTNEPHSNLPFAQWLTGGGPASYNPNFGTPFGGINQGGFERSLGLPSGLKRGRLVEAHPFQSRGDQTPFRVYFMFNPTEVATNYGFNESLIPPAFAEPADLSVPLMATGAGVGFALLFDRTFEVWKGQPAVVEGRKGPGEIGVLWDIQALERLMGIFHNQSNGAPSGPPTMNQIIANFGAEGGKSLTFSGFFTSVSVTYATFDANMTPTRARVDIQMAQNYLPKESAPTSTEGSGGVVPVYDPNVAGTRDPKTGQLLTGQSTTARVT